MNLKQLAELLNLSPTTVSRALNGYPEVSSTTRLRVMQAAEKYNYRPNVRAMSLATGRSMCIGHVIPRDSSSDVVNPVFGEFIAGASQTYSANGYELLLSIAEQQNESDTYRTIVAKGAVDGIIVHSPRRADSRIALLQEIGIPFVVHGRALDANMNYSWIDTNNRRAFRQATQLLIDLGHRRIALINGNETLSFAWQRRQGFEEAMEAASLTIYPNHIVGDDLTETHGHRSTCRMLANADRPTAFLVSSYVVALGVRRAISQAGLRMGEDISVIIHDDELSFFQNDDHEAQFTATRSSVREAGIRAAQMLLDIINDPSKSPVHELLEAQLTIGSSTGPRRRTS